MKKTGPVAVFSLAGLAVAFAAALLVLALTKPADDKDRPAIFGVAAVMGVAALAAVGWGVFLLANPRRSRPEEWLVCEDGLLRRCGEEADVFYWDELKVRKKKAHPLDRDYELTGHGGDPVVLKFGPFQKRMIHDVQKAQVRALRKKYLRAVEAGETVKFSRLGVSRDGLVYRKAVVPWDVVKALNFSYDRRETQLYLTVPVRGGGDIYLNASEELPNIWLFMELVAKVHPRLAKYRDSQDWWLL